MPWHVEFDGIVNNKYFYTLSVPTEIHHLDYFRYCSPRPSDKDALHKRWLSVILPNLKASKIQQVFDQHGRLVREWQEQTAETKEYWDKMAEDEANDISRQLDRKHHLICKRMLLINWMPSSSSIPRRSGVLTPASSGNLDDCGSRTNQPRTPPQPSTLDQAAAPSTTSSEFDSGPKQTDCPAPHVAFEPSLAVGGPSTYTPLGDGRKPDFSRTQTGSSTTSDGHAPSLAGSHRTLPETAAPLAPSAVTVPEDLYGQSASGTSTGQNQGESRRVSFGRSLALED
ncbi:hypothetical protein BGZ54_003483, partial [Gamsiella multidivaricata]